ncbi:ribonuclease P protein component [Bacteroidota bacterium]
MIKQRYTFKKAERLCSKKVIERLIHGSHTQKLVKYPFIFIWQEHPKKIDYPAQILINVSKKYSKKAVERNRIKRQIREIYRFRKHILYSDLLVKNKQIALIVFFIGKGSVTINSMEDSFEKLIDKLIQVA